MKKRFVMVVVCPIVPAECVNTLPHNGLDRAVGCPSSLEVEICGLRTTWCRFSSFPLIV